MLLLVQLCYSCLVWAISALIKNQRALLDPKTDIKTYGLNAGEVAGEVIGAKLIISPPVEKADSSEMKSDHPWN